MKIFKTLCAGMLCAGLLFSSCSSMTNTGKGALIGGGGGAALGAGIGALIGGGKGAAIGSGIGAAVGAGAGTLIGNRMDKQAAKLKEQLADANVETVKDQNDLTAIKVTFPGGILFPTNGTTLSPGAQTELAKFAASLKDYPGTNVQIYGFTDNTGTMAVNTRVSTGRADSVLSFLAQCGIAPTRLSAQGVPMADYVASNDTAEGRAQNRRVEIYVSADEDLIKQAEAGTLN